MSQETKKPRWDALYETASGQQGYFTTKQAAEAGYSTQLLLKHIRAGRVAREQRSIYRLVHFPLGEQSNLVKAWLWSDLQGVVSHETTLLLYGLSDVLPKQVHLTVPGEWKRRRLRIPLDVVLHHADVSPEERSWFGPVPTTTPSRSLNDCARSHLSPELLGHAARQAIHRGLVTRDELGPVAAALAPFGGLPA